MAGRAATPWGPAAILDEVVVEQDSGKRSFSTHVQLLETGPGERLIRLAYATGEQPSVRRGPVTLRVGDLERLKRALATHPELAAVISCDGLTQGRRPARGQRRRASPG